MLDVDTFLTTLYVLTDDFCKVQFPAEPHPGPSASLSRSEVLTLALVAQWSLFRSERAFYRYAQRHLRGAFPRLPDRSQFNRLVRAQHEALVALFLHLGERLEARQAPYEALDGSAVPVRNAKRRGEGWLCGQADIGFSRRLGWYEGFHLLISVTAAGVLTGYGFGAASAKEQHLAESFLALRHAPDPRLPSVGRSAPDCYLTDKGFEGAAWHRHWGEAFEARVLTPPCRDTLHPWPKRLRRWHAALRQIVEGVFEKLHEVFRLDCERPHALGGFQARLAAMAALHNFCIWLNRQLGRPNLAFADLIDW